MDCSLDRIPQCIVRRLAIRMSDAEGQDLVEYALLIMLIALIVLVGVRVFGGQVTALYDQVVAQWPT